jgi:hypothetical protein
MFNSLPFPTDRAQTLPTARVPLRQTSRFVTNVQSILSIPITVPANAIMALPTKQ